MERITLAHGAGGELMHTLIKEFILKYFQVSKNVEVPLQALDDASVIKDIVFTTDSYTVKPIFFPGGDIGSLAIAGTINDLVVLGAKPLALSCSFVIEEGLMLEELEKILKSIRTTSRLAGNIPIITGDTKVVEKGALEKIIINTSGIGLRSEELERNINEVKKYRKFSSRWLLDSNLRPGDRIIVTGTLGDHGITLLSFREGYGFESTLKSDIYPMSKIVARLLKRGGIVAMKDPTRGGVANTLNEFAEKSKVGIEIEEASLPLKEEVKAASELLGIDPLEIGNEGKLVIAVIKEKAETILNTLRKIPQCKNAAIIGVCKKELKPIVVMRTTVGGRRIIEKPIADPVPRIC
jgi:hydrogenase expression/formation protein HypE